MIEKCYSSKLYNYLKLNKIYSLKIISNISYEIVIFRSDEEIKVEDLTRYDIRIFDMDALLSEVLGSYEK